MTTTATMATPEANAPGSQPDAADGLFPIKLRLPEAVVAAGPDACEKWFVDLTLANEDAPLGHGTECQRRTGVDNAALRTVG